jgi:hypothetical protein
MRRAGLNAAATVAALVLAGCGSAGADGSAPGPDTPTGISGMCAPEAPDCEDTFVVDDGDDFGAGFDADGARAEARDLLGLAEDELPADVRVGRRGDEHFALTEDYVLGRQTVELDDGAGAYRVSAVVVELPDGPETITD